MIPLSDADANEEVTIYVKGFLARGETPAHFDSWYTGHTQLVESHGWAPYALGYQWDSGKLQKLALPVASAAKTIYDIYRFIRHTRSFAPVAAAGWFVAEQAAVISARFVGQFLEARRQASARAEDLASRLSDLSAQHSRVRVVAHSLGCLQTVEAAALLAPEVRPHEIHLCAPACLEVDVADKLDAVAREVSYVYYTKLDHVLDLSFRAISQARAIGASGLEGDYAGLTLVDVSHAFDFWVHTEYKNRFGDIAMLAPKTSRARLSN
jgi:hypothetical protein